MDISGFITQFISLMVQGVGSCYNILSSITFLGTNLLSYLLTLFVLSIVISVVLTLKKQDFYASHRERRRRKKDE